MTPTELFAKHPLPWKLRRWVNCNEPSCVDAEGKIVAIDNEQAVALGNAYPRAALAERAVELLREARELLSWWQGERGDSIHAALMERIDHFLASSQPISKETK